MNRPTDIDKQTVRQTMQSHGICVVIPTFNNAATLAAVVSDVLTYTDSVIVVNDGSTDATADILDSFGNRIHTVTLTRNSGKGSALKAGFREARRLGFRTAITIDSDGQHLASDIPAFVKVIVERPGAIIIGERDLSGVDINGKSSFANKFSNFWFNLQTGKRLRDTQTGYRAYPLERLYGLGILTSRYEAELELLVFASWNGVEIHSIPINVYYPPQSERVSHFRPGLDFTRISILNTFLCAGAILYGLPVRAYNAIRNKRIFKSELKTFTRKKGEKKEAATTLGRLNRSIFGLLYFTFWALGVFTPLGWIYFHVGRTTEAKKLRFHRWLQRISKLLTRRFPGAETTYSNPSGETFEKPAMIICNHQSHLDLPVLLSLSPRLIFLTNDWAWNNVFYSHIIHNAEFLPTSTGVDEMMAKLKDLVSRGYSIVIFPEGTRSADCSILRFHQGAFRMARELKLDIIPMTLHGAGHFLPKKDLMFRKNDIALSVMQRRPYDSSQEETTALATAKHYRRIVRTEYDRMVDELEKCAYFKSLILYKYAYRGWDITSRCKKILRRLDDIAPAIDNADRRLHTVRILNGGIGVVPLLFALVNRNVEVYAYEENLADFTVAAETAALPPNLHFIHPVWENDYDAPEGVNFDATYAVCPAKTDCSRFDRFNPIKINIR